MSKVLDERKALLLFSGGQDSTVCLEWALERFHKVYTIGVDYGQRHSAELVCRKRILGLIDEFPQWKGKLGHDVVLDMRFFGQLGDNALTTAKTIATGDDGLPNTFVPGRNLLFLAAAGAHAYQEGIGAIVAGVSQADYSGYPDCREHTLRALGAALDLGMDTHFEICTPLMHKNKADVWQMAAGGGAEFFNLVRTETHTCYVNDRSTLHDFGYGCGECPACILRKDGYNKHIARAK